MSSRPSSKKAAAKSEPKTQIEANVHSFLPRSPNTVYEVNMHAFDDDFDDEPEISEDDAEEENLQRYIVPASRSSEEDIRAVSSNELPDSENFDTISLPSGGEPQVFQEHLPETSFHDEVKELQDGIALVDLISADSDQGHSAESDNSPQKLSKEKKEEILGEYDPFGVGKEPENLKMEEEALMEFMDKPFDHARKPSLRLMDRVKPKPDGSGHFLEDDPRSKRKSKPKLKFADPLQTEIVDTTQADLAPPTTPIESEGSWSTVVSKKRGTKSTVHGGKKPQVTPKAKGRTNKHKQQSFCAKVLSPLQGAPPSSSESSSSDSSPPRGVTTPHPTPTPDRKKPAAKQDFQRAKVE